MLNPKIYNYYTYTYLHRSFHIQKCAEVNLNTEQKQVNNTYV